MGEEPSGAATSHATISTATIDTIAPPRSSAARPVWLRIDARMRDPTQLATACPPIATTSTVSSDTKTRASAEVKKLAKTGPSCSPIAAPPKKPRNESSPTTNPCR